MTSGKQPQGAENGGSAFNPWAPRSPQTTQPKGHQPKAAEPVAPAATGPASSTQTRPSPSPLAAGASASSPFATPGSGFGPQTSGPGRTSDFDQAVWSREQPHHRAPVADDARMPGSSSVPPTQWPQGYVSEVKDPGPPKRRAGALVVLTAFLAGALVVGAMFGSYAAGHRNASGGSETESSSSSTPVRSGNALDIHKVLDIIRPSVVTIQTGTPNSVFGGAGSGVIISEDGLILTNAHVVAGASNRITIRFSDGTTASAELVGASAADDIALVKADRTGLSAAALGSSANLLVGDPVVAIGNALNLGGDPSVTSGIVSAKDRSIDDGTTSLDHLIQTDAAINPGNSGGPLVDSDGRVVGINTAIIQGAQNIGFSIAIDSVKALIEELQAGGGDPTAETARLGVATISASSPELDDTTRQQFEITATSGAVVTSVDPSGAASAAGIQQGDVIVEIAGEQVSTSEDATRIVRSHEPGEEVAVVVERRGQRQSISVSLGS